MVQQHEKKRQPAVGTPAERKRAEAAAKNGGPWQIASNNVNKEAVIARYVAIEQIAARHLRLAIRVEHGLAGAAVRHHRHHQRCARRVCG